MRTLARLPRPAVALWYGIARNRDATALRLTRELHPGAALCVVKAAMAALVEDGWKADLVIEYAQQPTVPHAACVEDGSGHPRSPSSPPHPPSSRFGMQATSRARLCRSRGASTSAFCSSIITAPISPRSVSGIFTTGSSRMPKTVSHSLIIPSTSIRCNHAPFLVVSSAGGPRRGCST
jgi:hypothetical protein